MELTLTKFIVGFLISGILTFVLVYPIKKLAKYFNILDIPNERKVHKKPTPRLGGVAIVISAIIGLIIIGPQNKFFLSYLVGGVIIAITGLLDDLYTLRPLSKLLGQLIATFLLIYSGLAIERITLPFIGIVEFNSFLSIIVTVIWIIGITNSINLIDGLDGLASGVSTIALTSIFIMSLMDMQWFVAYLTIVMIGSNIGFLFHNFYPAKIYMGDTGSLFLGFSIAVISILGLFKKLTLFSFVIPIIVLAVPIFDTLFAILRRIINGEKIMQPDKKHIHHQLLAAGFSHRTTVLIIYGISVIFGFLAIVFSNASLDLLLLITCIWILMIYILAEIVGLAGKGRKTIVSTFLDLFRRK